MNPLLPDKYCIPDVEAHACNGRLYLYGSMDIPGNDDYCSNRHHVFSSDDMCSWTDHGVCYQRENELLYAPDCIEKDGKHYLYYCTNHFQEGVAVSDRPEGPFADWGIVERATGDSIDPAVFVDEDGKAYYYWGQFQLRGGQLAENMKTLLPETVVSCLLDEYEHGFHEGASVRRRGDWYYLVYADITRGRATCLGYAMSRSPLGPFEKQGILIDNTGCDPKTWNNHGSIGEFNGQWYVFYHRSSRNSHVNRRVCAEPIFFDENGRIREVRMTTQGPEPPLAVGRTVEAQRFCYASGNAYADVPAENAEELVCHLHQNDWVTYRFFDLPEQRYRLKVTFRPPANPFVLSFSTGSFVGEHTIAQVTVDAAHATLTVPVVFSDAMPKEGRTLYVSANSGEGTLQFCDFCWLAADQD